MSKRDIMLFLIDFLAFPLEKLLRKKKKKKVEKLNLSKSQSLVTVLELTRLKVIFYLVRIINEFRILIYSLNSI